MGMPRAFSGMADTAGSAARYVTAAMRSRAHQLDQQLVGAQIERDDAARRRGRRLRASPSSKRGGQQAEKAR